MGKVKLTLITTVLNEEDSLRAWLESVSGQVVLPDELVVVDGGSTDKTKHVFEDWARQEKRFAHRFVVHEGNRSVGRNKAIDLGKGDIIMVSDAGCVLDIRWVKLISAPFDEEIIDVVAGNYTVDHDDLSIWGLVGYQLTAHHPKSKKDCTYLASSRSLAFRKQLWKKVGGYPEDLDTAEDLVFAKRLQDSGRQVSAPKAIVYWRPVDTFMGVVRMFYNYAYGDGVAGNASIHSRKYYVKLLGVLLILGVTILGWLPWWGLGILVLTYAWWQTITQLTRSDYVGDTIRDSMLFLHVLLLLTPVLFVVTLLGFVHGRVAKVMGFVS